MVFLLVTVFVFAFLISLNVVPRMMRWARKTGFLDHPEGHKTHDRPVPYGGGFGVAAGVLLPALGGVLFAWADRTGLWTLHLPDSLRCHLPGACRETPRLLLLLGGCLAMLFLGFVDDLRKLRPSTKLSVQTAVALVMALCYERLSLFSESSLIGETAGTFVTVLWIVGITNAFNLLDHMDGLSAGVAAVASVCFLGVAALTGQWFLAALLSALIGSCLGFLVFNFPPARVYLGDAGSLFIGFLLACLTVDFTFYSDPYPLYAYAVPLVILAVPLFDTAGVIWIRLKSRRSIFQPDTNHFAHRLVQLGLSKRTAVCAILGLTFITGIAALLLYQVDSSFAALAVMGQVALVFFIITLIENRGRRQPS